MARRIRNIWRDSCSPYRILPISTANINNIREVNQCITMSHSPPVPYQTPLEIRSKGIDEEYGTSGGIRFVSDESEGGEEHPEMGGPCTSVESSCMALGLGPPCTCRQNRQTRWTRGRERVSSHGVSRRYIKRNQQVQFEGRNTGHKRRSGRCWRQLAAWAGTVD